MLNLQRLKDDAVPDEIISSLVELQRDMDIEEYNTKGNNSYVFLGNNRVSQVKLAIKYYYYGQDMHEEVQLLASIDNDNVIKVLDAHTIDNGWAYFLTHQMTYGDIDDAIAKKIITYQEAIEVVKGILKGLTALHSNKRTLLHRDLKPANILLDDKKRPIIADFGSLKILPEGQRHIKPSRHAILYRPPEAYSDDIYLISSDLYQVGLVMYQLLGGYLPYNVLDWLSERGRSKYIRIEDAFEKSKFIDELLYRKAKNRTLTDFNTLPKYVSDKVKNIIKCAIRPDYTKRYQSCSLFLLSLHELGYIPKWMESDDIITLVDYKGLDYRVVKRKELYIISSDAKTKLQLVNH